MIKSLDTKLASILANRSCKDFMLADAKKYGARVALHGRKINNAEHQLSFVKYLRAIVDSQIVSVEAVKAYHGDLAKLGITLRRSLENDLQRLESTDGYR